MTKPVGYPVTEGDIRRGNVPPAVGAHTFPCGISVPSLGIEPQNTVEYALDKIAAAAGVGLKYKGTWDATNPPAGGVPTLADGVGIQGDYYVVTNGGIQNLGSGPIDFSPGDWIAYNGTIWQKADHTDVVTSVFGRQGAIVAVLGDYAASLVSNDSTVPGATVRDALNNLSGSPQTVTTTLNFLGSSSESATIALGRPTREVLRGRVYITSDPGPFNEWANISFYNKAAKKGEDAFYRIMGKQIYTELKVATTGVDANIIPDAFKGFSQHDLAFIQGVSTEFARLQKVSATMIAEDNVAAHSINTGLSRVTEFGGVSLFNFESATDVYLEVSFSAVQTVNIQVELILGR